MLDTTIDKSTVTDDTPVGCSEIAALCGVSLQTVYYWRGTAHRQFPQAEPTTVSGKPWWRWGVIREWDQNLDRGRSRDRRPTVADAGGDQ